MEFDYISLCLSPIFKALQHHNVFWLSKNDSTGHSKKTKMLTEEGAERQYKLDTYKHC